METIIFTGIQATGKSSFFKEHFFNTHVRISMDLLNTRNKEQHFMDACFTVQQRFVIDNTNPQIQDRAYYIKRAKAHNYKVTGYYFQSKLDEALQRNSHREGKACISEVGIRATHKRLELPSFTEGFDELYYVEIGREGFIVKPWQNEI